MAWLTCLTSSCVRTNLLILFVRSIVRTLKNLFAFLKNRKQIFY